MELEAKGQAKLMIRVRQLKAEVVKLKQTVVSRLSLWLIVQGAGWGASACEGIWGQRKEHWTFWTLLGVQVRYEGSSQRA